MANTSGSKIEASNHDFNTLFNAIFSFLHDDQRVATTSTDSKITSYTFKGSNTYPHNINASVIETSNNIISNDYTTSLNIIYDIISHNYMKTNGLSSTNINEYKTTGSIIPALDQHIAIVNYWNNNGSSACNGACVGYCIGNCADNESKGTGCNRSTCTGSGTVNVGSTYCANCANICKSSCGGCGGACQNSCTTYCADHCSNVCGSSCRYGCDTLCDTDCGSCASGCSSVCKDYCSSTCLDACSDTCRKGCQNICKGCYTGCSASCVDTCDGSNTTPLAPVV